MLLLLLGARVEFVHSLHQFLLLLRDASAQMMCCVRVFCAPISKPAATKPTNFPNFSSLIVAEGATRRRCACTDAARHSKTHDSTATHTAAEDIEQRLRCSAVRAQLIAELFRSLSCE